MGNKDSCGPRFFIVQNLLILLLLVFAALGCSDNDGSTAEKETLTATITRTSYGVPHIKADNLKSLAFGQGYAFAEDGLCILADQIVKIRSERSMYFGPGENDANIISDLGYKALNVYNDAVDGFDTLPQDIQDIITGYVAGYNTYLADTGTDALSPECRSADWVKPIDEIDYLAYLISVALLASGENFIDYIAQASPPEAASQGVMIQQIQEIPEIDLPDFRDLGIGSNGWGIGRDMTENGKGALLANPHFPATGPLKFWESHLTIPDDLNISGATLYGAPLVLIGFNENLGWTHTVADSVHFTVYKLRLVDGNPTAYHYDGQEIQMSHQASEIQVLQEDGSLKTVSQTHYKSHYGVMLNYPGVLGWTDNTAYTLKDANENNLELLSHWLAMDRASSLEEFQNAFQNYKGIPWVNAIYADDLGNSFYIDGTPVPNLSQEVLDEFQNKIESDLLTSLLYDNGIVLLDGEDPKNEWQGDLGNGLVPYEDAPKLTRTDFTSNSNDSHWLTNPDEPLEGYSLLYGPEKTTRSLRTRMGFALLDDSAGDDGLWSATDIENALLSNRGMLSELVLEDLLDRCQARGDTDVVLESGEAVDISEACGALDAWDGRVNPDSKGAHVFREFGSHFTEDLFATPFDVDRPVETPNGLAPAPATGEDPVLQCLALAAKDIETAGIPVDAELGDIHFMVKNGEKIPFHGGKGANGVFNMIKYSESRNDRTMLPEEMPGTIVNKETGLYDEGYLVNYGTSIAFALEFTGEGPKARGILTYSQSNNSESPHFDDQTKLFSRRQLRPMLFTEEEIAADKQSETVITAEVNR